MMNIQKDAKKLLKFFYDEYIKDYYMIVREKDVIAKTNWESNRINTAMEYLMRRELINPNLHLGTTKSVYNFEVKKIPVKGIKVIENKMEI